MMDRHILAKFAPGQVVRHHEFKSRCVIVDVDPIFFGDGGTAAKAVGEHDRLDRPWYHVLINGREHVSYVSENSITADDSGDPVMHPSVGKFFQEFQGDRYVPRRRVN